MIVVYNDIIQEIDNIINTALANNRSIKKIQLTRPEWEEFQFAIQDGAYYNNSQNEIEVTYRSVRLCKL